MNRILVILAFSFTASLFSSCENKAAVATAQKELEDLESNYEKLREEEKALAKEKSAKAKLIRGGNSRFDSKLNRATADFTESQAYVASLEKEEARLAELMVNWKAVAKTVIVGKKLDRITTSSGKEILGIVVTDIDDEKLEFTTKDGPGSEKLSDLTPESLEFLLSGKALADQVEKY